MSNPELVERVARAIYDSHSFVKDWQHPDTVRLWHPVCKAEAQAALKAHEEWQKEQSRQRDYERQACDQDYP